jgi:phosphopantetheine--protein transferase-like protein
MKGIGIDIESVGRFKNIRYFDRFLSFVFTKSELLVIQDEPDKVQYVASRFVVKEAVIKALPEKVTYLDFEVIKKNNKPCIKFVKNNFVDYNILVSLSHSMEVVVGFALVN